MPSSFTGTFTGNGSGLTDINSTNVINVQSVYNFKDYALTDDGVTDTSVEFQSLLDAVPKGSSIFIPKSTSANGWWKFDNTIRPNKPVHIYGDNVYDFQNINLSIYSTAPVFMAFTNSYGCVRMENLTIHGNGVNTGVIISDSGSSVSQALSEFKDIAFKNVAHGIVASNIVQVKMERVTVTPSGASGGSVGIKVITETGDMALPVFITGGTGGSTASNAWEFIGGVNTLIGTEANATNTDYLVNASRVALIGANGEGTGTMAEVINNGQLALFNSRIGTQSLPLKSDGSPIYIYPPSLGIGLTWGGINFIADSAGALGTSVTTPFGTTTPSFATNSFLGGYHPITRNGWEMAASGIIDSSVTSTSKWGAQFDSMRWGTSPQHRYEYVLTNFIAGEPKFMWMDHFDYLYDKYVTGVAVLNNKSNWFNNSYLNASAVNALSADSQNFGVGTPNPLRRFHIHTTSGYNNFFMTLGSFATGKDGFNIILPASSNQGLNGAVAGDSVITAKSGGDLLFGTGVDTATAPVLRMRLAKSGILTLETNLVVSGAGTISGNGSGVTNTFNLQSTNYIEANFTPIAGMVKLVASNNWMYSVTPWATNQAWQIQP